jgi:hypothetical protein
VTLAVKNVYRAGRAAIARLIACALPAKLMRDKRYFGTWERRGYHVTPVHYYSAVPNTAELEETLWSAPRPPVGIDMREGAQLELLEAVSARYASEFSRLPREAPTADCPFFVNNGNFFGVDAAMLYCMVRKHRPRNIIEIGSGFSTLLSSLAIERNKEEDPSYECKLVAVEPFPKSQLLSQCKSLSELIVSPVQKVPLDRFRELGSGDILFIDSSHVSKLGSDVNFELLEIVPRVRDGVLVHVHDVFIPFEYPRNWAIEEGWFWNEQYLLQAFLSFNRSFEIVWAGSYMHWKFPESVAAAVGPYEVTPAPPASLWMRRVSVEEQATTR